VSTKRARPARRPTIHIKAGDTVYVRAGRDRESRLTAEEIERLDPEDQRREANRRPGRRARVLRVLPDHTRVVVEGVNMLTKHARPRGRASKATQLQTGRMEQPGPISIANVMLVCPRCDRPTRVRKGTFEGKAARICRRCSEPVDAIR
jgi:large subunit ribosomal protein L24